MEAQEGEVIVVVERRGRSEESESGEEEKQAPGDGGDQREDAVAEMAEVSPENGGSENDAVEVVAAAVSLLLLHLIVELERKWEMDEPRSRRYLKPRDIWRAVIGPWFCFVTEAGLGAATNSTTTFARHVYTFPRKKTNDLRPKVPPLKHIARVILYGTFFRCGRSDVSVSVTNNGGR